MKRKIFGTLLQPPILRGGEEEDPLFPTSTKTGGVVEKSGKKLMGSGQELQEYAFCKGLTSALGIVYVFQHEKILFLIYSRNCSNRDSRFSRERHSPSCSLFSTNSYIGKRYHPRVSYSLFCNWVSTVNGTLPSAEQEARGRKRREHAVGHKLE